MVNFYVKNVEEGMKMGAEAAAFVSEQFIKPIKIDFEKVRVSIAWVEIQKKSHRINYFNFRYISHIC